MVTVTAVKRNGSHIIDSFEELTAAMAAAVRWANDRWYSPADNPIRLVCIGYSDPARDLETYTVEQLRDFMAEDARISAENRGAK